MSIGKSDLPVGASLDNLTDAEEKTMGKLLKAHENESSFPR